jgi:hypothetical protein
MGALVTQVSRDGTSRFDDIAFVTHDCSCWKTVERLGDVERSDDVTVVIEDRRRDAACVRDPLFLCHDCPKFSSCNVVAREYLAAGTNPKRHRNASWHNHLHWVRRLKAVDEYASTVVDSDLQTDRLI